MWLLSIFFSLSSFMWANALNMSQNMSSIMIFVILAMFGHKRFSAKTKKPEEGIALPGILYCYVVIGLLCWKSCTLYWRKKNKRIFLFKG